MLRYFLNAAGLRVTVFCSSPLSLSVPGEKVATRAAYGTALMKLCQNNPRVIGLDGDTKNSTFSEKIKKVRLFAHEPVLS